MFKCTQDVSCYHSEGERLQAISRGQDVFVWVIFQIWLTDQNNLTRPNSSLTTRERERERERETENDKMWQCFILYPNWLVKLNLFFMLSVSRHYLWYPPRVHFAGDFIKHAILLLQVHIALKHSAGSHRAVLSRANRAERRQEYDRPKYETFSGW